MKKLILFGIVALAAITGGSIAFAWNRVNATPVWYQSNAFSVEALNAQTDGSIREVLARKLAADTDGDTQREITLNETEVSQLVAQAASENRTTAQLLEVSQGLSTRINDDRIESGAVVNFAEISTNNLPPQGQQALDRLTQTFPMLADRDVYIGLSSQPQIIDGQLQLGENTVIKVGGLSFPLSEVASQLGLSQTEAEQQLSALLTQQGITLDDIEMVDGQITFVAPQN